jgi:aminoglycoside phosphotransferase family enzyme
MPVMAVETKVNHHEVPLQEKVKFLKRPEAYPEGTGLVEAGETHMSWVFLTDRFVYKMKKPVHYDFLDYSTLEARRYFCEEEIRLNRRLAGAVYLAAVPLVFDHAGQLQLGGAGIAVEWLVKMKRLPHERMLDCSIRNRTVREDEIRALIFRLARFYQRAVPVSMEPDLYLERIRERTDDNRQELTLPKFGLPNGQVGRIHQAQHDLLDRSPEIFKARAAEKRIVEAHGDLRPEHVCLGPEPVIIDCLEFEREFRILDPVEELAFLAMECEMLGAEELSRLIFTVYQESSADRPPDCLIDYYKSYRACLRAKIALWHIEEVTESESAHWRSRARDYLSLAEGYVGRFR